MKRFFVLILALVIAFSFTSCDEIPDSQQMNIYKGVTMDLKFLHLNASTDLKKWQINGVANALVDAEPIDKDISLFGYYPDFTVEVSSLDDHSVMLTAIVDINGDYVEFYYPGPYPEESDIIYRSNIGSEEFLEYVHS